MMNRLFALGSALVALCLFVGSPGSGGEKDKVLGGKDKAVKGDTHVGTFVSAKGDTLMMDLKGKEHSHTLSKTARITDEAGKTIEITALKRGQNIRVTTEGEGPRAMVTRIEVLRDTDDKK